MDMVVSEALSGGKRMRAVLSLLWCEAVSGSPQGGLPVAVAYELAHAAALVQDDILDNSEMRRGDKSIVGKYGLQSAMLASNMLLAQVPRVISEYGSRESGGEVLRKLFELLGESFASTIMGEFLDLGLAEKEEPDEADYEHMIRLKTGALIGASSASGAVVGGALEDDSLLRAAYSSGEWMGMAYQVQDDLLDILGDERVLGKPVFADIRAGKKNLVLIHALEKAGKDDRAFLGDLLGKRDTATEEEMKRVRAVLSRTGSIDYSRQVASRYADNARKAVEGVKMTGKSREKLLELSEYLVSRKY